MAAGTFVDSGYVSNYFQFNNQEIGDAWAGLIYRQKWMVLLGSLVIAGFCGSGLVFLGTSAPMFETSVPNMGDLYDQRQIFEGLKGKQNSTQIITMFERQDGETMSAAQAVLEGIVFDAACGHHTDGVGGLNPTFKSVMYMEFGKCALNVHLPDLISKCLLKALQTKDDIEAFQACVLEEHEKNTDENLEMHERTWSDLMKIPAIQGMALEAESLAPTDVEGFMDLKKRLLGQISTTGFSETFLMWKEMLDFHLEITGFTTTIDEKVYQLHDFAPLSYEECEGPEKCYVRHDTVFTNMEGHFQLEASDYVWENSVFLPGMQATQEFPIHYATGAFQASLTLPITSPIRPKKVDIKNEFPYFLSAYNMDGAWPGRTVEGKNTGKLATYNDFLSKLSTHLETYVENNNKDTSKELKITCITPAAQAKAGSKTLSKGFLSIAGFVVVLVWLALFTSGTGLKFLTESRMLMGVFTLLFMIMTEVLVFGLMGWFRYDLTMPVFVSLVLLQIPTTYLVCTHTKDAMMKCGDEGSEQRLRRGYGKVNASNNLALGATLLFGILVNVFAENDVVGMYGLTVVAQSVVLLLFIPMMYLPLMAIDDSRKSTVFFQSRTRREAGIDDSSFNSFVNSWPFRWFVFVGCIALTSYTGMEVTNLEVDMDKYIVVDDEEPLKQAVNKMIEHGGLPDSFNFVWQTTCWPGTKTLNEYHSFYQQVKGSDNMDATLDFFHPENGSITGLKFGDETINADYSTNRDFDFRKGFNETLYAFNNDPNNPLRPYYQKQYQDSLISGSRDWIKHFQVYMNRRLMDPSYHPEAGPVTADWETLLGCGDEYTNGGDLIDMVKDDVDVVDTRVTDALDKYTEAIKDVVNLHKYNPKYIEAVNAYLNKQVEGRQSWDKSVKVEELKVTGGHKELVNKEADKLVDLLWKLSEEDFEKRVRANNIPDADAQAARAEMKAQEKQLKADMKTKITDPVLKTPYVLASSNMWWAVDNEKDAAQKLEKVDRAIANLDPLLKADSPNMSVFAYTKRMEEAHRDARLLERDYYMGGACLAVFAGLFLCFFISPAMWVIYSQAFLAAPALTAVLMNFMNIPYNIDSAGAGVMALSFGLVVALKYLNAYAYGAGFSAHRINHAFVDVTGCVVKVCLSLFVCFLILVLSSNVYLITLPCRMMLLSFGYSLVGVLFIFPVLCGIYVDFGQNLVVPHDAEKVHIDSVGGQESILSNQMKALNPPATATSQGTSTKSAPK
jgi:hypothetical protein